MLPQLISINRILSSQITSTRLARHVCDSISLDTFPNSKNKQNRPSLNFQNSEDQTTITLEEELYNQIDIFTSSSISAPLDLNKLPLSNPQLKNDYRIKQFVQNEQNDIYQHIRNAQSLDDLFNLIRFNQNRFTANHIALAFASLLNLGRSSNDRSKFVQEVLENPNFKRLCYLAINKLRYMEPFETLFLLKTLTFLSMNPRTLIMTGVLNMIRYHINEYQANELVLIDYLLFLNRRDNEEKSDLIHALCLAVPLVFESKMLNKEVQFDNLDHLLKYLNLATNRKMNGKYVNQILIAVKLQEKNLQFDYQMAIKILTKCASLSPDDVNLDFDLISQVCKICNQKIIDVLKNADYQNTIISDRLWHQIARNYYCIFDKRLLLSIYDHDVLDLSLNYLSENFSKLNLEDAYQLIYNLSRLNHYSKVILENFYFKLLDSYENFMHQNSFRPARLIYAFFTPLKFDKFDLGHLFNLILNPKKLDVRSEFDSLTSIVQNLCVLGIHEPVEIYEAFFRFLYNERFPLLRRKNVLKTIRKLYIEMCTNENIPDQITKHKPKVEKLLQENEADSEFSIQNNLIENLNFNQIFGENRINEIGFLSHLGHRIGYVAIYDLIKQDLVCFQQEHLNKKYLEDIRLPSQQKLVHFLFGDFFCRSPHVLKPNVDYYLKTISRFDLICVLIDQETSKNNNIKNYTFQEIGKKLNKQ